MKKKKKAYPDHSSEINRLPRISGQLEGIERMIKEKRDCVDILTQTRAITSALRALEGSILDKHLRNCVLKAFKASDPRDVNEKINELMDLFKKRIPS